MSNDPSNYLTSSAISYYLSLSCAKRRERVAIYRAKANAGALTGSGRGCALNLIEACKRAEDRAPYGSDELHEAAITASLARMAFADIWMARIAA